MKIIDTETNCYSTKKNQYNMFYLIFVFLLTFCKAIGLSGESKVYITIFLISLVFWGIKFLNESWTKKEILFLSILFVIIIVNFYITKQETLLLTFLIITGLKGVSIERIFAIMFKTRLWGFIAVFLSATIGLVPNKIIVFWRAGSYIERYSYGFSHPNLLHSSLALIILLYVFLYYENVKYIHLLFLFSINVAIYQLSFSRTGFISVLILLILTFGLKYSKLATTIISRMTVYIQFLLFFFTIIMGKYFKNTIIYSYLDNLLTGRLGYVSKQLEFAPTLFGRNFDNTSIMFDNSYSMILSMYGVLITAVLLIGYFLTAVKVSKKCEKRTLLLFLTTSIFCFTESFMPNTLMNLTLIFMGKCLFGELNYTNEYNEGGGLETL